MSSGEGFKMLGKHVEGCFCADHAKYKQPFIVYEGADFDRRKNGDRGGSTMWHRFKCNDTECGAIAIVRWDVLAEFIAEHLPNPDGGTEQ